MLPFGPGPIWSSNKIVRHSFCAYDLGLDRTTFILEHDFAIMTMHFLNKNITMRVYWR